MEARRRGLPATIIRPGYILGESHTGVTNSDDFIWRLVKGCLQLGHVPIMSNVVNMCPVDYVADITIEIASKAQGIERGIYHVFNTQRYVNKCYNEVYSCYAYIY
jgi:L-aminoadipate-semialdehyde dehydrogenase